MIGKINRYVKSFDVSLPAPVGGLNKRDPLVSMHEADAIKMDNYIPTSNSVELRPGYEKFATFGAFDAKKHVETLCAYKTADKSQMIGVYDGKAYVVSAGSVVPLNGVHFSKNRCQTLCYRDRLFLLNGVDVPKVYYVDSSDIAHLENWGFVAENIEASKIVNAGVCHEFLWFVEKNSTRAWVSSVAGNISGSLNAFDAAQVIKWGGHLVAVFAWTLDGGAGIDDYTCLLTSEGEVLVYKGYNPNDSEHFALVGSYKLSKPIGYQCVMPYQGDVILITQDGYLPLSSALSLNNASVSAVAFSDKIRGLVLDRAATYKNLEGWQGLIYGKKGYAIFNVPVSGGFEQHVINMTTAAWARWTNIRAFCWCVFEDNLYFASDNAVFKFGDVYSDDGMPIEGVIEQAYSNLGYASLKKIVLIKPKIKSYTDFLLMIWTNMDFDDTPKNFYISILGDDSNAVKWNVGRWSKDKWSSLASKKVSGQWLANSATGFKASIVFKTKTKGNRIEWYETALRVQTGTGIL